MKVVFVAKYYLPHIGGVEKHIFELTKRLKIKKIRIVIVCEQTEGTGKRDIVDGVAVYRLRYPHTKVLGLLSIWWWFWKHRKLIKEADVIHCHDVIIWYLPFRFLYPKKPLYATFHGWEGVFPIQFKYKIMRKVSALVAKGNICVGKYLEKWYGTKANYVTYGGVSNLAFTNFHFPFRNSEKILYVGRLDKDTGIKTYLEGYKILKTRVPGIRFEFLGDGKYREEAQELGVVHGFKTGLDSYVKDSRFVCTSGYLSILEALSAKRLVFTVSENEIKFDILSLSPFENYTIHTTEAKVLARRIEFFLEHSELERKIIERGYEWSKTQTWENVSDLYLKLWNHEG